MAGKSPEEQLGVPLPEREEPPEIAVEESDRPGWLPDKFETPEAYVESYKSLEAELTRRGEDQRRLEAQVEQLGSLIENLNEGGQQQQQQPPQNVDQVRQQLEAAYEVDPIGTMAMLMKQYANQTFEERMQLQMQAQQPYQQQQMDQQNQMLAITVDGMMSQRHPDWNDMKELVAQEIRQDEYLLPEQVISAGPEATARALDRVYTQVKAAQVMEQVGNGTYQTDTQRMKMQAQGLSGTGGRPGQPTDAERDANAIVAAAKNLSYSGFRSNASG